MASPWEWEMQNRVQDETNALLDTNNLPGIRTLKTPRVPRQPTESDLAQQQYAQTPMALYQKEKAANPEGTLGSDEWLSANRPRLNTMGLLKGGLTFGKGVKRAPEPELTDDQRQRNIAQARQKYGEEAEGLASAASGAYGGGMSYGGGAPGRPVLEMLGGRYPLIRGANRPINISESIDAVKAQNHGYGGTDYGARTASELALIAARDAAKRGQIVDKGEQDKELRQTPYAPKPAPPINPNMANRDAMTAEKAATQRKDAAAAKVAKLRATKAMLEGEIKDAGGWGIPLISGSNTTKSGMSVEGARQMLKEYDAEIARLEILARGHEGIGG